MKKALKSVLIIALAGPLLTSTGLASIEKPELKVEYASRGQYYLQVGQPTKAINNFEELIRQFPKTREAEKAWLSLGDIYLTLLKDKQSHLRGKLGELEKNGLTREINALRAEAQSLKHKALNAYQMVVNYFPNSRGLALVRIGKVYAFHSPGEEETGRGKFREVMSNFPEQAGRAILFLGDSYLRQNKFEKAKNAYYQARFFYPEVAAQAQLLFSKVDQGQKYFSSTVSALALVLDPLGIDGYFTDYYYHGNVMWEAIERTAECMVAEGNRETAIDHLKNIINKYPDTNIAFSTKLYLAETYNRQGKKVEAQSVLDQVISHCPQSLYAARAYLKKAEISSGKEAVLIYGNLRKAFPRSKFWEKASRALADKYLDLVQRTSDDKEKKEFRRRASGVIKEIMRRSPQSPEWVSAQEFLKLHKL
ncbi:MAG: tetratricopeptide repeat protein [Candidatus Euphemobacter frigidus]|nr:tetratricopeptide repeat protein [Candidatus Euphemobacter frigidus]MDP8276795.1 tetratricopeptide repeat protein [Candidatus Euphemobacter frigidus]